MNSIRFVAPAWLWLLLSLVPLIGLTLLTPRRVARWRLWASLVMRCIVFTALVLALAGLQLVTQAQPVTTVFVIDSSDSVSPAARAKAEAYVQTALRNLRSDDQAAVIAFGSEALIERAPSNAGQFVRLTVAPPSDYTDIQRALQLALAVLPSETRKRIILLSDGGENRGRALDAATLARAAQVPIETVSLLSPPPADDVALESLEAPTRARANQAIRLTVQAQASQPTNARLRILLDRQPVLDTTVELVAGLNRLPVTVAAPPPGFHAWEARLEAANDGLPINNVAFGFSDVRGAPRIAIIEGAPGRGENLAAAFTAAKLDVIKLAPAALPTTLIGLDTYDAVVLVDVGYRALPPAAAKLLPTYVRELGRGLLMVGGADSYAAGGYLNTPIEAALPVTMRTRGVKIRPDVALMLVIDHSDSMSGDKLDLAREGAAQAFAALNDDDQIGVVVFDNSATTIVPLQKRPPSDVFLGELDAIGAGGGTNIRPGLESAADALEKAEAKIKHIVLLTDGQADQNYDDVIERLKQQSITLSTVGVGEDYDQHLQTIAPLTGGRFFEALDFNDIPRIFLDETLRISRRGIVEHDFVPKLTFPSTIIRDLTSVPILHGYNATTPKETAQVVLASDEDDPILAQWQYGLGRSIAWTSDLRGQWAKDWVAWSNFGQFAAQLGGALLPAPTPAGLEASTEVEGNALVMQLQVEEATSREQSGLRPTGRLIAADGRVLEVPLIEVQPGRYRGTLDLPLAGVYQAQVVINTSNGDQLGLVTTGAVVPPSAEYIQRDGNLGLLQALADTTGGRFDFKPEQAFTPPIATRRATVITWPLIWLALLLWPLDIALRRLLLPRPALVQAWLARQKPARVPDMNRQRARIQTLIQRKTPPPTPPTSTPPPPSPSASTSPTAPTQFDWRKTRRARVERPSERDQRD